MKILNLLDVLMHQVFRLIDGFYQHKTVVREECGSLKIIFIKSSLHFEQQKNSALNSSFLTFHVFPILSA